MSLICGTKEDNFYEKNWSSLMDICNDKRGVH